VGERAAFVLNLDADLELASTNYSPTASVARATSIHGRELAKSLLRPGDVHVEASTPDGACAGFLGRAFSLTPRARRELERVGAIVPDAPTVEVLRAVSRRDFAYVDELGDSLCSDHAEDVLAHLRAHLRPGRAFRLKRVRGMAGRGHRIIRDEIGAADEAFVRASRGLIVEPNVEIDLELAMHGWLRRDGSFVRGALVRTEVDSLGRWMRTTPVDSSTTSVDDEARVARSLEHAAESLHAASYFGAFGIDAYLFRREGVVSLRSRSEIHPRYSMGWPIGMRMIGTRPDFEVR